MSTHLPRAAQTAGASRAADFWPVLLCWVAVALDGYDLVVLGVVIPTLLESGALGFTGPTITTASTLGFGRHGHWRRLGRAADRPVRSAQEPYHQRRHVLALHNRDRPRAKRWPVHDLPFPGRARPRRLSADGTRVHERARADRPWRLGDHPDDDRLPRGGRALRVAGAVDGRGLRLAVDVRGRRRTGPTDAPIHVGRSCQSPRHTSVRSSAATGPRRGPSLAAPTSSRAATSGSASASAWRRSRVCCSCTDSTPGCRRSCATPAIRFSRAPP